METTCPSGPISQELVMSFIAGDRGAFRTVFGCLRQGVLRVIQRFFPGAFDQEEAFQEVWLQIYRARSGIDVNRHAELGAWSRQVARNRCLDLLKSRRHRRELPVADGEVEVSTEATQPGQLAGSRVRATLEGVLQDLDDEQRQFFQLCFVDERSHEEIASRLSISERRSKYLKKKLLARLLGSRALRRLL